MHSDILKQFKEKTIVSFKEVNKSISILVRKNYNYSILKNKIDSSCKLTKYIYENIELTDNPDISIQKKQLHKKTSFINRGFFGLNY